MKINEISPEKFRELFYEKTEEFWERIHVPEVFVVKSLYPRDEILAWRAKMVETARNEEPSWHPLLDGCPDYNRLHDNYEKAYVKGKIHTFYHHGWYEKNRDLFTFFGEIFRMKNYLAGGKSDAVLKNIPSNGWIARVNFHHYPKGGGYQAEHIDPDGKYAKIQTIVQASQIGKDFRSGGVYARMKEGGEKFFVDSHTSPGDVIVMSPAIYHGVAPVDPEETFDWKSRDGRWIVLPIFVHSDYDRPDNIKPKQVS